MTPPVSETKMNDEMKPCPFCGSDDIAVVPAEDSPDYDADYPVVVACMDCSADGPDRDFKSAAEAIAVWNRRALPSPPYEMKEGITPNPKQ
jgi:Lar family restriction alleviation protein